MSRWLFGGVMYLLVPGAAAGVDSELHVVAVYEGSGADKDRTKPGTAVVKVDRPGKDVTLVLSATQPVAWEVSATPKTNLVLVIIGGSSRGEAKVPAGVQVAELSRETTRRIKKEAIDFPLGEPSRFRPAVRALHKLTGLEIDSYGGCYRCDADKVIVVDSVRNDEQLRSDYPRVASAKQLPDIRFMATRLVLADHRGFSGLFGEFTQSGPQKNTLQPLPKGIVQATYDPGAKRYYGITGHELHTIDLKTQKSEKFEPGKAVKVGWLRALTYDSKRERVLITGRNAMYEYVTKNGGNWSVLVPDRKGSFAGLAWQADTDTLFALGQERGPGGVEQPTLYELNVGGAVVKRTPLGSPMFPGVFGRYGLDARVQLIDRGAVLAALIHNENRDENGEAGTPESFLYLIDPKTGKVQLAWKE